MLPRERVPPPEIFGERQMQLKNPGGSSPLQRTARSELSDCRNIQSPVVRLYCPSMRITPESSPTGGEFTIEKRISGSRSPPDTVSIPSGSSKGSVNVVSGSTTSQEPPGPCQ